MDNRLKSIFNILDNLYKDKIGDFIGNFFYKYIIFSTESIANFKIGYNHKYITIDISDHTIQDEIFKRFKHIPSNRFGRTADRYFRFISFKYNILENYSLTIEFVGNDFPIGFPVKEKFLIDILDLDNTYNDIILELENLILDTI
jgi:hypothetical protein